MTFKDRVVLVVAVALVAAACSGGDNAAPEPTTSTTAATSTTTASATTRATVAGPSSTLVYIDIEVSLPDDDGARLALSDLYGWLGDRTRPQPDIPQGLAEHLAEVVPEAPETIDMEWFSAAVGESRVGVATADDDIVLLADEGEGWKVVGAWLARYGSKPWFGEPLRYVLTIGTDARPGQDQQNFRADSLHILSSNIADGSGGVLGIPRDTFVEAPYGGDKFTNVNVFSGQETMVDLATEMSGLPLEGYIITGFTGFSQMVDAFGGVMVDVPFAMADSKSQAYLSAGWQRLWGSNALAFSRNRSIPGSDFTRSEHQGLVILGALAGVLERDIRALPSLLEMLDQFTWTNLATGDLLTLAAGAFLLDPAEVGDHVLPGTVTTRAGASVVILDPGAEDLFRDMDDGSLTP